MLSVKEKVSLLVETNNKILEQFAEEDERQFKEIERLQAELAELPKKICEEIKNSADCATGLDETWLRINWDDLDAIQEKYTEGETK